MRWFAAMLVLLAAPAAAGPVPDPNMRVDLLSEASSVAPGQSVRVGLRLKAEPGWHTYWRNPGDAGSPTEIAWTLPDGVTAGPIEWPVPLVIKEGDIVIFGYEGEVLLPSTIRVPASARPGETLSLKAGVYYVVCREICIPGEAELALSLPVGTEIRKPAWPDPPGARPGWSARMTQDGKAIVLTIETAGEALTDPMFLPYEPGQVSPDGKQIASAEDRRLTLRLARAPELRQELQRIDGLLLATQIVDGQRRPLAVVVEATR